LGRRFALENIPDQQWHIGGAQFHHSGCQGKSKGLQNIQEFQDHYLFADRES
jgi:hypothetical protein